MFQPHCFIFFPSLGGGELALNYFEIEGCQDRSFEFKPKDWKDGDPTETRAGGVIHTKSGSQFLVAMSARQFNDLMLAATKQLNEQLKGAANQLALPSKAIVPGR